MLMRERNSISILDDVSPPSHPRFHYYRDTQVQLWKNIVSNRLGIVHEYHLLFHAN